EALEILRTAVAEAKAKGDLSAVSLLARHAGVVSAETGDLPGAIGHYQEALAVDPTDPLLHLAIGGIHREIGQYDEARSAFERGLRWATQEGDVELISRFREIQAELDDEAR
ncbi:MAG: hypothetical protein DRJ42_15045, partial [Deltaproteobacteria bacterium]